MSHAAVDTDAPQGRDPLNARDTAAPPPNDRLLLHAVAQVLRDGARLRYATLDECGPAIAAASRCVVQAVASGHKVLTFGNGGSAADAQHIAAELVGRFVGERDGLPGLALTVDSSALTSIANDYGFDHVFARQVRALGTPGDVAIAITTSGTSPNILAAIDAAAERGMSVVCLTGARGAALADRCDVCVIVPSTNTARIQEVHTTIGHLLCEAVDSHLLHGGIDLPDATTAASGSSDGKVVSLEGLVALRERWRAEGRVVVWTNGVFDVLHVGHVASLRAAHRLGDVLVVGVNADEAVRAAKGRSRPAFPAEERAVMLAALEVVDHVVVFDEATPIEVLDRVRPDVHCKGEDYAPPNGLPLPEADTVRAYGGRIEFLPLVADRSTTEALDRLGGAEGG